MFRKPKKMASSVSFVIVLFCIQQVFAIDCWNSNIEDIKNCDDCIRCGGEWCKKPKIKGDYQCLKSPADDWCPGYKETPSSNGRLPRTVEGTGINPIYKEASTNINARNSEKFVYNSTSELNVNVDINSTQNNVTIQKNIQKSGVNEYSITLKFTAETDFCSSNSTTDEFFVAKIHVDTVEKDAYMKYYVPCACECSKTTETNSEICNGNGDYSCGICQCHDGWSGDYCDKPECKARGDIACKHPLRTEDCSGNGRCDACGCVCDTDKEGSQYFDQSNFCADLCLNAYECDSCFDKPAGRCPDCHSIVMKTYNESLMAETDEYGRNVWVKCNDIVDDCNYHYVASKDKNDIILMVIDSCKPIAAGVTQGVNVTLPLVLVGVALVCAAAGAAYMIMRNRAAPMPPTSAQYQELDGPKTRVEENPTYKSPTTSYNNPLWRQKV
ncbi:integrin beta-1-like [Achroia grisella]|uniref:integrin beta-1-like n=1 Tax=Achroia grisella TaxID=688607 RepID=UPI0027D3457C|nr:integrin beta-1-like [Achroia grisella]